jgi:hypothetical protein
MINHWWDAFGAGPDAPDTTVLLAMIAIAERPPAERQAWRAFFGHLVFRTHGHPLAHLPAEHHGLLGPLKPDNWGYIRESCTGSGEAGCGAFTVSWMVGLNTGPECGV